MMATGAVPDVPSPSELWKNEKSQYRLWMILFGVGLTVLIGLYLSALIWNIVEQQSAMQLLMSRYTSTFRAGSAGVDPTVAQLATQRSAFESSYRTWILILPGVTTGLLALGLGFFAYGLFNSYRAKSFEKLSSFPTVVVSIAAILAFSEFASMIWRGSNDSIFPGGAYLIAGRALALILGIFVATPVGRIRRAFLYSRQIANLKANPEFQEMQRRAASGQGGFGGQAPVFGPFGMPIAPMPGTQGGAGFVTTTAPLAAVTEVAPEVAQLNGLDLDELKGIASRLSLSGYETMNREQLIENILRVTPRKDPVATKAKVDTRREELTKMNLLELRRVAKSLSISGYLKMTKLELIETILRVSTDL